MKSKIFLIASSSIVWGLMAILAMPAFAEEKSSVGLQTAYEREFAFLAAQSKILDKRLKELDEKFVSDEASAQSEINNYEDQLLAKRSKSERLDTILFETERTLQERQGDKEFFQNTISQSENTLKKYEGAIGGELDLESLKDKEKLETIFSNATTVLTSLASVTKGQGEFFLTDGTKVGGNIIKVGNIAAYGISDSGSGMLAPAGDGKYKLWPEPSSDSAKAIDAGLELPLTKIFLFESIEKDITPQVEKTALEVVESGGSIAWAIVALGMLAILLCLVRVYFLKSSSTSTDKLTQEVSHLVSEKKIDEAIEVCKKKKGSIARIVGATIRNLDRDRDHLEDIVSENILHETSALDRFGTFILVIAAVSPLLGLLGTVTGMIATFDIITEFGTGDPKLLSGGIAIALVTTELGLIVAIPILLIGNVLSGWSERIKHDMERSALRITNVYENACLAERNGLTERNNS